MPKERTNPNLPPVMKTKMSELSTWDIKLDPTKIPYVSHVPGSPIKMTESRKKRIRKKYTWFANPTAAIALSPSWPTMILSIKFKLADMKC